MAVPNDIGLLEIIAEIQNRLFQNLNFAVSRMVSCSLKAQPSKDCGQSLLERGFTVNIRIISAMLLLTDKFSMHAVNFII